jgi:hypothetical protein
MYRIATLLLLSLWVPAGCDGGSGALPEAGSGQQPVASGAVESVPAEAPARDTVGKPMRLEDIQAQIVTRMLSEPWTGDLDGMIERRVIRVLREKAEAQVVDPNRRQPAGP